MLAVPNGNIQILNCVTDDLQTICHAQFVCASITHLHAKLHISSHNVSTVIAVNLKAADFPNGRNP